MSKIKIYDGVVIDMGTSEVLELGESRYVDSSVVAYCGGGGGGGGGTGTTTTTSGFDPEYDSNITGAINAGQGLYDTGQLGQVTGFTPAQLQAQQAGMASSGNQTALENAMMNSGMASAGNQTVLENAMMNSGIASAGNQTALANAMMNQANQGVDLSGMRAGAKQKALQALGLSAANAGRTGGLGGSRQAINQQSIANDLAAKFAGIDQLAQQQNFNMMGTALGAQGAGAETMAAIGMGQQQQAQNVADAPYAGLSQLSNIYGGFIPQQTNVISEQGGGGK